MLNVIVNYSSFRRYIERKEIEYVHMPYIDFSSIYIEIAKDSGYLKRGEECFTPEELETLKEEKSGVLSGIEYSQGRNEGYRIRLFFNSGQEIMIKTFDTETFPQVLDYLNKLYEEQRRSSKKVNVCTS